VKQEGAAEELKKGWGQVSFLFHRKGRKERKGFCYLNFAAFAFFAVQYSYSLVVCSD
jgi:hypothetical protein